MAIDLNQFERNNNIPETNNSFILFVLIVMYVADNAKNIDGISLNNIVDCPQLFG